MKKKNKDLNESVDAIESIADAFEQINYMLNNNIPLEIVSEEEYEGEDSEEKNEEDVDDQDFDEMNDVWDEMDEEN